MLKEFREFVLRGNVIDLAVGIIIGVAFGAVVNSLVTDIIMPPIGRILGGVDFSNLFIDLSGKGFASLAAAKEAGAPTINIGLFINTVINFLVVALAVFFVVKAVNQMMRRFRQEKPAEAAALDPALESQKKLTEAVERLTKALESKQM
jgi:large conductance mechanosensitive channel